MTTSNPVPTDAAPTVATLPSVPGAPAAWSSLERVGFRYLVLHWLLYSLPQVPQMLCGVVAGLLAAVPESWRTAIGVDLAARPWRWPGKWAGELGTVGDWWEQVTTWMWEHGLAPYEVIHQPTGSGDTGHDIARLLAISATSLVLTLVWSLLDRSRGYPRLGRWMHALVRFEVAFILLGYGWAKVLDTQFGELHPTRLLQTVGDTSPMGLVGTLMKANRPYEVFSGLGEVLGAVLLFHRRTALLGAFVSAAVMANVVALNWLCGVPVKLFSAHLLLAMLALMLPFRARLWDVFVGARGAATPVDLRLARGRWAGRLLAVVGWGWALAGLGLGVHGHLAGEKPWQPPPKSALYGVWSVDAVRLDGQEVPATDASRWRVLAIDRGTRAFLRDAVGKDQWLEFAFDPTTNTARVKPRGAAADAEAAVWSVEQGTRTVPVDVPLLLRQTDRGRKVDGERRTLRLRGAWSGKQLELDVIEMRFRLQAGFRLRQELPEGW